MRREVPYRQCAMCGRIRLPREPDWQHKDFCPQCAYDPGADAYWPRKGSRWASYDEHYRGMDLTNEERERMKRSGVNFYQP